MNTGKIVGLVLGVFAVLAVLQGVSLNNDWVDKEEKLTAQYKQNQNSHSTMINSVLEAAQVPKEYAKDLKEVFTAALVARNGEEGSKAVLQVLQEQNPQLSPAMYVEVQQMIQSNRISFAAEQKTLLDIKRAYIASLRKVPGSLYSGLLGYPTIDLNQIDIITSKTTNDAFDKKEDVTMKVFN